MARSSAPSVPPASYYTVLNLTRDASSGMVEAAFRRAVARYRPATAVMQLMTDTRFLRLINAYLTLHGAERASYDLTLTAWKSGQELPKPEPFSALSPTDKQLLTARFAYWRREMADTLHLLRQLTEREPNCAPAWALMGEFFFTVDKIEDGVKAYERAVAATPGSDAYKQRLEHARNALKGQVSLQIEPSPEEEILREERRSRWRGTLVFLLFGAAVLMVPLLLPITDTERTVLVPWLRVGGEALGIFLFLLGLGYGRLLQPFERVMVWASVSAGDRGYRRSYPYGLILLVTSLASLWLALVVLLITAMTDEEWPASPSVLIGLCGLANAGLAFLLFQQHLAWGTTAIFGGNLLVLAGMLGWWFGSLGTPTYD